MTNDSRIKAAGLRMALKMLPPDIMAAAPAKLEEYLAGRLRQVEPEQGEAGTVFMLTPQRDGHLAVLTVTLDEQNTVRRIVGHTDITEIFGLILDGLKEM